MVRSSYDVVVIGAGPVGCVAAAAAARTGARVLVLEQNPDAARRFAGEWIHPTGVSVLDRLRIGRLEGAEARTGYGFVVFPDDGSDPIELPYPTGQVALACEHSRMVGALRERLGTMSSVEYVPQARVVDLDAHTVTFRTERGDLSVHAGRVLGCDGRSSLARKSLGLAQHGSVISYMAGVELKGAELPVEGYGHVVLGGPGPVLLYRIGPDAVRACFDVPVQFDASRRNPAFLWDAFSAVLPERLRPAFRDALERRAVHWAVNRFAPRAEYGRSPIWLLGDAVGHFHPLTAAGITLGMQDAECASVSATLGAYQEEREQQSYVPELLSNALYHVFTRDDASAVQIRSAVYKVWRDSRSERERTMRILMGAESRRPAFGAAFGRMALAALGSTMRELAQSRRFKDVLPALHAYREWAQWPAASLAPSKNRKAHRAQSTSVRPMPIPGLRLVTPVNDAPHAACAPERRLPEADLSHLPSVERALASSADALLAVLKRLHERIGRDPDWALMRRATRIVSVIESAELGTSMSARMKLARRPMARVGMSRLLAAYASESPQVRAADFASFMISMLSAAEGETVDRLEDGVRHLLSCQRASGGFAPWPQGGEADFETTELACRALAACHARYGSQGAFRYADALERATRFLLEQQREDGSFPRTEHAGSLSNTVHAMCALSAAGQRSTSVPLRKAARFLCQLQADDGTWATRTDERVGTTELSARAVRALLTVRGPHWAAVERGIPHLALELADAASSEARTSVSDAAWERCCDVAEALVAYEKQRRARPRAPLGDGDDGDDWAFCKASLVAVSRTFSKPIAMLPGQLEVAVTCGYLLCRIADTVEDHAAVPARDKDRLFGLLLDVLERGAPPRAFALAFEEIAGSDAELDLARNLPRVMRTFWALPERMQNVVSRWVAEMARGMGLYTHREPGEDGFTALYTVEDLERYCYYVAGTVGHMLTELFAEHMGDAVDPATLSEMRRHSEAFGAGLQLVNILKDVTDDRERRWSFVPRAACEAAGIAIDNLVDPAVRSQAHQAVAPLFDLARAKLDHALEYALAVPSDQKGVRLFCLLPLWMAALTLVHGRGNDAMFVPGAEVKISRSEVDQVIAECLTHASDDAYLRARYRVLFRDPTAEELQA